MRFTLPRVGSSRRQEKKATSSPSRSPCGSEEALDLRDGGCQVDCASGTSPSPSSPLIRRLAKVSSLAALHRLSSSSSGTTRDSCEENGGHLRGVKLPKIGGQPAVEGDKSAARNDRSPCDESSWYAPEPQPPSPRMFRECYATGSLLGEGASSHVLTVHDRRAADRKSYACKTIRFRENDASSGPPGVSSTTRADVEVEVGIMRRLGHKNLVCMHDSFVEKGTCYIVMELMEGGDLMSALRERGSLPEDDCREVVTQLLRALVVLHKLGIAHRDLKLENVMLRYPGSFTKVALVDFGMAREMKSTPQLVGGTPLFVAPEILLPVHASEDGNECYAHYGVEVDMWSLGVILYMLLAGYPPFQSRTLADLFASIKTGRYAFQDPAWELISDGPKDLVKRLLTKDPARRVTAEAALSHPWITETW